jgi:hypothetical protein
VSAVERAEFLAKKKEREKPMMAIEVSKNYLVLTLIELVLTE